MSGQRLSEHELQRGLLDLARLYGWRVFHVRPARTGHGWRTPVEADGAGFPDLVLVRDRVVFAELKSATGRVRPAQAEWLAALAGAGAECHVWRPADLEDAAAVLGARSRR